MSKKGYPRRTKLINPRFQVKLIGSFVGLAGLALLMQFLLLGYRLTSQASLLDGSGELAMQVPGLLLRVLVFSVLVLLPLIFAFGVLLTFRIAGPVYRFEEYLSSVARGEQVGPCRIRKGDELQSLCNAINAATESLRRPEVGEEDPSDTSEVQQARAAG